MSVARLQQLLIFALITTVIAWLIFAAAYVPAFVVIGVAFAFAFGYAWVLAFEFALLLVYGAKHGGLRPTLVQDRLYELNCLELYRGSDRLSLMTIARWSHSFPSRTGP